MRALLIALSILMVGALGYFVGARQTPEIEEPNRVVELTPTPTVITALRQLARLEGAALHVERVVDLKEKQTKFLGLVEAEDAILLVAAGDVTAGVDLSKVESGAVSVDETSKKVHVILPRAEIFSTRLDSERTYVHTRSTDTLAERQTHLETAARQEAERGFKRAAEDGRLTERAEESVARTVRALILSLGFTDVEVVFEGGPKAGH